MFKRKLIRNQMAKKYGSSAVKSLWLKHQVAKYGHGNLLELRTQSLPKKKRRVVVQERQQ